MAADILIGGGAIAGEVDVFRAGMLARTVSSLRIGVAICRREWRCWHS